MCEMKGLSATDKDNFFVELEFSFRPSASWEEAQSSEGFEGRKEGLIAFLPARITCFVCFFLLLAVSSDLAKSAAILFMHTA